MSRSRMSQDEAFWRMVKGLNWKLDDGRSGPPPPGDPEFSHGVRRTRALPPSWTTWASHAVAYLFGGVSHAVTLAEPALLPAVAMSGVGSIGLFAYLHRR